MVVGPETPVEEATAVLVALAEQVARAVVVSFDRTPFGLKDGLRSVPGVAPRDAKAVVGGALPLPAPVTLFDLPVPGDGRRQLLLAREVPPTREGRTAYRLREIEFVGEAVMPMPVEIELDVSGPIPDRDDVLPAAARRVVDPLGAGRAIRRMLPGAERLSPFEQQEAMTSYAGLLNAAAGRDGQPRGRDRAARRRPRRERLVPRPRVTRAQPPSPKGSGVNEVLTVTA